jgi:glutamine synthetase
MQAHSPSSAGSPRTPGQTTDRFIVQKAHERGVASVELWGTAPSGRLHTVTLPRDALEVVLEEGYSTSAESFEAGGLGRELILAPDPASFQLLPRGGEAEATGRLICDFRAPDGSPSPLCSRSVLKSALGRAAQRGSNFYVGATLEHRWLEASHDGPPRPLRDGKKARALADATARGLDALGIAWRSHSARSASHQAFELEWMDPLMLADALVTHRWLIREVARAAGLDATLMPVPWTDATRSRLDLYVSLVEDHAPAFLDPLGPDGLSPGARTFVTALEAELGGLALIVRGTVNSFSAADAPWLGVGPAARGEGGPTVHFGGLDACSNPYLVLALVVAFGLDRDAPGRLESRPSDTLVEAARRAVLSPRIREVLGAPMLEVLAARALGDSGAWRKQVTAWEIEHYRDL